MILIFFFLLFFFCFVWHSSVDASSNIQPRGYKFTMCLLSRCIRTRAARPHHTSGYHCGGLCLGNSLMVWKSGKDGKRWGWGNLIIHIGVILFPHRIDESVMVIHYFEICDERVKVLCFSVSKACG